MEPVRARRSVGAGLGPAEPEPAAGRIRSVCARLGRQSPARSARKAGSWRDYEMIAWDNLSRRGRRGRLSARIDPLRGDRHAAGRRGRRAQDRLGQHRGDQRAQDRPQGPGPDHPDRRRRQGRGRRSWSRARPGAGTRPRRSRAGRRSWATCSRSGSGSRAARAWRPSWGAMLAAAWPVGLLGRRDLAGHGRRVPHLVAGGADGGGADAALSASPTTSPIPSCCSASVMAVLVFIRHHATSRAC